MFSVKGSTSKRAWLVHNLSLTTLMEQLKVKNQEFVAEKMREWKSSDDCQGFSFRTTGSKHLGEMKTSGQQGTLQFFKWYNLQIMDPCERGNEADSIHKVTFLHMPC